MNWTASNLGELCDEGGGEVKTGPFGSQLHQSDYSTDGTPVVMPKDIVGGRITEISIARVGSEHVERLSKHKMQTGDIVYGRRGDIGRCALITQKEAGWLCGTGCLRISLRDGSVEPQFLFYFLNHPSTVTWIYNQAVGATMPNLNTGILRSVPIRFPARQTQQRIASILSGYDDLIENNTRRIAILEEMARRLYEEWFVHFRFTGHEETEFEDDLPKGWHRGEIAETYEGLFDGPHATPSPSETGPVFLGIKNIRDAGGLDLSTIRHIAEAEYPRWTKRVVPEENDVVFTYEATLNRYALVPKGLRCCLGRRMALIRPKSHFTYFLYLHFFTADWREVVAQRTLSGATVDRIPLTSFPTFPINLPPEKLVIQFDGVVRPLIRSVENLSNKNTNLRAQRDLLLPKLVSGEIDVSDAEGALEAAE